MACYGYYVGPPRPRGLRSLIAHQDRYLTPVSVTGSD